ncbi:MAG: hypothetical protein HQ596_01740 [Candidatus Saganbacteria bacterium]|nr:hypothetical protein [Candidatus Saganbacteria bacterium]
MTSVSGAFVRYESPVSTSQTEASAPLYAQATPTPKYAALSERIALGEQDGKIALIQSAKEVFGEEIHELDASFTALILALMWQESTWGENAGAEASKEVLSKRGIGLMQMRPKTCVEMLIRMDKEAWTSLGIDPEGELCAKLELIGDLEYQSRRQPTAEAAQAVSTQYYAAIAEAEDIILDESLLNDKQFNVAIGTYYMSYLLDRFDGHEHAQEVAILAYHRGEYYSRLTDTQAVLDHSYVLDIIEYQNLLELQLTQASQDTRQML